MREIIFRGKSEYDGEWIHGGALHQTDNYGDEVDRWFIIDGTETLDYDIGEPIRVIPETIGQYTGLTDKNGTKIFEGDIVRVITVDDHKEKRAIVGFDRFFDDNTECEYIGFYIYFLGMKTTVTQLDHEQAKESLEVIGNIHDNPELMETQDGMWRCAKG